MGEEGRMGEGGGRRWCAGRREACVVVQRGGQKEAKGERGGERERAYSWHAPDCRLLAERELVRRRAGMEEGGVAGQYHPPTWGGGRRREVLAQSAVMYSCHTNGKSGCSFILRCDLGMRLVWVPSFERLI